MSSSICPDTYVKNKGHGAVLGFGRLVCLQEDLNLGQQNLAFTTFTSMERTFYFEGTPVVWSKYSLYST